MLITESGLRPDFTNYSVLLGLPLFKRNSEWGACASLLHVVAGREAGVFLEEFDKIAAAGESYALADALDGEASIVGKVVHAAASLTDAVVG